MAADQLVYLIYGKDTAFLEARYSIVSAFARQSNSQPAFDVTVFTDRPQAFAAYPVQTRLVTPAELRLRGPQDFNHRAKIPVLASLLAEGATRVLYVDADTLFLRPIGLVMGRIDPGQAVMHQDEGPVFRGATWNYLSKPIGTAYPDGKVALDGGGSFTLPPDGRMWNAGVVGIHAADAPLCGAVLQLTDAIYGLTRAFTAEQLAFSLVLGGTTRLRGADDVVNHYWNDISYGGWHAGKSIRQLHHAEAESFFAAHPTSDFDDMVRTMRLHPPCRYRVTLAVRARAYLHRQFAAKETPRRRP